MGPMWNCGQQKIHQKVMQHGQRAKWLIYQQYPLIQGKSPMFAIFGHWSHKLPCNPLQLISLDPLYLDFTVATEVIRTLMNDWNLQLISFTFQWEATNNYAWRLPRYVRMYDIHIWELWPLLVIKLWQFIHHHNDPSHNNVTLLSLLLALRVVNKWKGGWYDGHPYKSAEPKYYP